jgi:type IV secretory pathway VirB10-like protein
MTTVLTRRIPARAAIAVVALALLASLVSGREKPQLAASAAEESVRTTAGVADLDPAKLKRPAPQPAQAVTDPFAASPPAAPPTHVQQAAPPGPTTPALPFRYVGRAVEDSRVAVFLEHGNQNYSVAQGEHAGRDYRVEQITDAAVTFTYLPLGARQTLVVPALN